MAAAVLALAAEPRETHVESGADGRADGWIIELGAGTGEIGRRLAGGRFPYLGLDRSASMLARFGTRLETGDRGSGARAGLALADLDRPWPVASGRARLLFASRVAHRLDPGRLAHEASRVAAPGARLVLGRVRRGGAGVQPELRRRLHELLAAAGVAPRDPGTAGARLGRLLAARGAAAEAPREAARWTARESADAVLAGWRGRRELAGRQVDAENARGVLAELAAWARERWDDLEAPLSSPRTYEIVVHRLDAAPRSR